MQVAQFFCPYSVLQMYIIFWLSKQKQVYAFFQKEKERKKILALIENVPNFSFIVN